MLIDCPACARSYHVGRAEIGEAGRTVVCPRCEASWFVDRDGTSVTWSSVADLSVAAHSARPPAAFVDERPARRAGSFWGPARSVLAGVACLGLAMGGLGARTSIVRAMPRLAGLYAAVGLPVNVRGLEIEALAPTRPDPSPSEMTVAGTIRNVAARRVVVPRLLYQVRDGAGVPLLTWTETAPARTLATGRTLPFVSSPHRLPPDARSILVRFEDADPAAPIRLARSFER